MAVGGQYQSEEANTYGKIHNRRLLVSLSHFEICKSNLISLCLYQYDSLLNYVVRTRNKHHLTVIIFRISNSRLHNSKLGEKFHFLILHILTKSSEGFSFRYRRLDMSKKLRGVDGRGLGRP